MSWPQDFTLKGPVEDEEFHKEAVRLGSFPRGERPEPYQEYFYKGLWRPGERDVLKRAEILGFHPKSFDSVIELGSQMGGFLQLAVLQGASHVRGIDIDPAHVAIANTIMNQLPSFYLSNVWEVVQGDITNETTLRKLAASVPRGHPLDHLLILSMAKHIGGGDYIEKIVPLFNARTTYIETNAVKPGEVCAYEKTIVDKLGGVLVGNTTDRNTRRVYRITRRGP
jgi:hypothetical protein